MVRLWKPMRIAVDLRQADSWRGTDRLNKTEQN
jgi:hypothetical protein